MEKYIEKIKKYDKIIFAIILILQIIAIIYATSKREFYHIDELYSHGLMQYKRAFIYENEDFINSWHTSKYFKDYLTIDDAEKWDFRAIYKNQVEDVHPPIYYLLLRIACTFNIGKFSIWSGTILNIIFFILSNIMLYFIGKKVFKDKFYALLLCCFYGFSLASIETVMYIRMYQLLILNILVLVYWHLIKKDKENLNFKDLIQLYVIVIFGFLTHYYYAIFLLILYVIYLIKHIKSKSYSKLVYYTLTLICSILTSIIIFPYLVFHILFSYRGVGSLSGIKIVREIILGIIENIKIMNTHFFNGLIYLIYWTICFIIIVFIVHLKYRKKEITKCNDNIPYVIIPMIIYFLIISVISPYFDLRYLMPIIPLCFCSLLYLLYYFLSNILNKKVTFCILLIGIIIFSMFTIPKLSNNSYTYNYNGIAKKIIEDNLKYKPCIYVYTNVSPKYNKMMDTYQALMIFDETYVIDDKNMNSQEIIRILKDKNILNGDIVVITDYLNEEKNLQIFMDTGLFSKFEYQCRMGRFELFLLE